MTAPVDADFRRAYQVFGREHERQREALVAKLAETGAKPQAARKWPSMRVALAATLMLMAGAVALFGLRGPEHVYGVEGLKERLLAVRSLHIKGWLYQQTMTEFGKATLRFPTETFHERPYRQYSTSYGFSFGEEDKLTQLTRSARVGDESRTMLIDHDGKRAIISPTDKLGAELSVESMFQQSLIEKLGQGAPDHFAPAGSEHVRGVMCDVYEHADDPQSPMPSRTKLWLDPRNGMPVKMVVFSIEPDGDEPFWEWDDIAVNVDAPPEMFSFAVPEGYEKIEVDSAATGPSGGGSAGSSNQWVNSWIGLNIDDQAVLFCWSLKTIEKDGPQWFKKPPEFLLEGAQNRPCDEIALRTDEDDPHWRWSLIVPRDRLPVGAQPLRMICKHERTTSIMGATPLVFAEARLAKLVKEVQRRTLPAGAAESEIWTLPELRAKLATR